MLKNCKIVGANFNPIAYHATLRERGTVDFPVSSSMLRAFGQCPSRWRAGYVSPDSKAKDFGSVLDCLLLTPELFEARYAVPPKTYDSKIMECPECGSQSDAEKCRKCGVSRKPTVVTKDWNANSNTCSAWIEGRLKEGKEIVHADTVAECQTAIAQLQTDEILRSFTDASDKQVLVRGEWHDEKTGLIIPVQCLIDLAPRADTEFAACLGDFKSTRTAALMAFQRDAFKYGYHVQAAFDFALWNAATGEDRNTWCFVLQESFAPWQTGRRMLSQDFLALGIAEYTRLLENYCACLKSDRWPTYEDTDEGNVQGWSLVSAEPFMAERAAFAPKFDFDEPDAAPPEESSDPEEVGIIP